MKKGARSDDFDPEFAFAGNQEEYLKDSWNDHIAKFLRKKHKSTLDMKIKKVSGGAEGYRLRARNTIVVFA